MARFSPAPAQDSPSVPLPDPTVVGQPGVSPGEMWDLGSLVEPEEEWGSPPIPALGAAVGPPSFLDVARESLFGDAYSESRKAQWRDLTLRTFFTDG